MSLLRADTAMAQASLHEYNDTLKRMRTELVSKKDYFRAQCATGSTKGSIIPLNHSLRPTPQADNCVFHRI